MKNIKKYLNCVVEKVKGYRYEYDFINIFGFLFVILMFLFIFPIYILIKVVLIFWMSLQIIKLTKPKKLRKFCDSFRKKLVEEPYEMSEEEKVVSAGHEVGHAIMCYLITDSCRIDKITIIPDGIYLGYVDFIDMELVIRKNYYIKHIYILLAGMVAEEVLFGEHCNGCAKDLSEARQLACDILNSGMGNQLAYSEIESAKEVDELLQEIKRRATTILRENEDILKRLQEALIEKGTLNWDEMQKIIEKD